MRQITNELIENFKIDLVEEEKAQATIEKYIRDILAFVEWLSGRTVEKQTVLEYKQKLIEKYAPASVNSVLSSLNRFFAFAQWFNCRVKSIKIQKQVFAKQERELTKKEYDRLLSAALHKDNKRLYLLMQTICSTGIRVSELKFITVEAVKAQKAIINLKGKTRSVFLPDMLCKMLLRYIKEEKIKSGSVFVSKNGIPLDRCNIYHDMKKLCESANVDRSKVFPHNLRHLFARTYYSLEKDISRLADILGHSSINTTRIYTMETGEIHRKQIQKLGLLRC